MKRALSIDPRKTALLCIDLQEEHRQDRRFLVEGFASVLANVRRLQDAARAAAVPVVHAAYIVDTASDRTRRFHPVLADGTSAFSDAGDPLTALCAEVAPSDGEFLLVKEEASTFATPALSAHLTALDAEWLVVCGVWSEACVDASVRHAVAQGYRVLLVKDACGSGTVAMHQTAMINLANRLYGGAVADTATALRLLAGETVDAWQVRGAVPLRYTFETAADIYASL